MPILRINVKRAVEVFGSRPLNSLEIRFMWSFKYPVHSELVLGDEFEQLLDDGATPRDEAERVLEALVQDGVLVESTANGGLVGEVDAAGLLAGGIAGDVAAMGNWAQQPV